jgi:Kef-type K+ transport system membrane component KefB/nucleotide-binding universal stress UspA family protein
MHAALALFLGQAIVIVAVSRALGIGARRIGQPLVIAEIIAGILLGPSALGALAPDLSHALFPAPSLGVLGIVAQLGLVLFMFLVGLELDPELLRGRGKASVAISHSSIVVPFVLGALLAIKLHEGLAPAGTKLLPFSLFLGVAMSITAFPVLARILTERRLLSTEIGAVTIACAAVDDVTAWCLLAFVVSVAKSGALASAVVTTVLTFVYVAVMAFVVRPALRHLAERRIGREAVGQGTVAITIVLLLLSAWATERIGIHALFGAFAFGMVIPRSGDFAKTIADKTEDLVVVLLLPLFFAYSGLRTQIGLISGAADWAICALIIAVACVGKFGGSYAAARLSGIAPREAGVLGILMNTRGLMELVVLNIGLDLGVISPKLFTMMVLMAVVTTVITTPLLSFLQGRPVAMPIEASVPSMPAVPAWSALVCTAYERGAAGMMAIARALARRGDRLYALRLLPPNDRSSRQIGAQIGEPRLSTLSGLVEAPTEGEAEVRPLSFVSNDAARDICDVASVKAVDLVVLGWHRSWFGRSPIGGTVQRVLGRARGAVSVFLDRELGVLRRVLVVLQGTGDDATLLSLAERFQSSCEIVLLDLGRTGVHRTSSLDLARVTFVSVDPRPAEEQIVAAAEGVDLILLGLDGALAEGPLLDRSRRSILLVRRAVGEPEQATARPFARIAQSAGKLGEAAS